MHSLHIIWIHIVSNWSHITLYYEWISGKMSYLQYRICHTWYGTVHGSRVQILHLRFWLCVQVRQKRLAPHTIKSDELVLCNERIWYWYGSCLCRNWNCSTDCYILVQKDTLLITLKRIQVWDILQKMWRQNRRTQMLKMWGFLKKAKLAII